MRNPIRVRLFIFLPVAFFLTACAHVAPMKDLSGVYQETKPGAKKITLSEFADGRPDKSIVGVISMLTLKSSSPINAVITDRIAARLRDEGFNIQKLIVADTADKAQLSQALSSSASVALITGTINDFFVASMDAVLEKATGRAVYNVRVFDANGSLVFNKIFSAVAQHYIGLTGQWGSEKAIELTIQATVGELFKDDEFKSLLKKFQA